MGGATPAIFLALVEKLAAAAPGVLVAVLKPRANPVASGVLLLGRASLRVTVLRLRLTADMIFLFSLVLP